MNRTEQHNQLGYERALKTLKRNCKRWDEKPIDSMEQLAKLFITHGEDPWLFRGESKCRGLNNEKGNLFETSLNRAFNESGEGGDILKFEDKLNREFKRKCSQYISKTPSYDNWVEWLAFMQHYGAPTRLLDWTYSFFIAVYFALENAKDYNNECCVWAIDYQWLSGQFEGSNNENEQNIYEDLEKREKLLKKEIFDFPQKRVYTVNPGIFNERLIIQQGVFLCPGDMSVTFAENLAEHFSGNNSKGKIIKYAIDTKKRNELLRKLHRMNINRASLFPGIDGFAKSIGMAPIFPLD